MKIIHSYWSRPSLKSEDFNLSDRNKGGWVNKKYNYMSWTLSCLQFRQFYDDIELVTDSGGYDILINKLGLPYTSVKVVLDELNDYPPDLWALGKIYAYSIQSEPFIHVDGDVYIWGALGKEFHTSPLVAQNLEDGFLHYEDLYIEIEKSFEFMPSALKKSQKKNGKILAVNAGLLGGNDIEFFKYYAKQAFDFVDRNIDKMARIDIGMFNTVYEQALFYALAEEKQVDISFYKSDVNNVFDGFCDFYGVPDRVKYIHTVAGFKRNKYIGDLLAFRLQKDYPEYYFRILNLLNTYQL